MGPQLIQSVRNSWKDKDEVKLRYEFFKKSIFLISFINHFRESLKWLETELVCHRLHLAPVSLLIRINETVETMREALDKFG